MNESLPPQSSLILYQTEDGRTRVQCRLEGETLWLSQALMAELFQVTVPTVNEHRKGIYAEGELAEAATIRKFRIVRTEGRREVTREIEHYSLEAILAGGYRVRNHRGTQFRQWATARLTEYLVKGFTMDDERLKNPQGKGQKDYFDELLERWGMTSASGRRRDGSVRKSPPQSSVGNRQTAFVFGASGNRVMKCSAAFRMTSENDQSCCSAITLSR